MGELRHAAVERNARLTAVRERERRRRGDPSAFRTKRPRPAASGGAKEKDVKDDDFLPEDADAVPDDGLNLSAEVRALMAQLDKPSTAEEIEEEDVPKVRPPAQLVLLV